MPAYHSAFQAGEYVRIADIGTLREFQRNWKWHHPLTDDQLVHAGQQVRIASVSYYHGGTTLYEFASLPGFWHESCLRDLTREPGYDAEAGAPACDYYAIAAERRGGLPVVVVRDPKGREMLVTFQFAPEEVAEAMRDVARVRSRISFEIKYGFGGIYTAHESRLKSE